MSNICIIEDYEDEELQTPPFTDHDDDSEFGCCFPSECCMPGPHMKSECCTAEMMQAMYDAGEM